MMENSLGQRTYFRQHLGPFEQVAGENAHPAWSAISLSLHSFVSLSRCVCQLIIIL